MSRDNDPFGYWGERAGTLEYGEAPMFPKRRSARWPEPTEQEIAERKQRATAQWDRACLEAAELGRKTKETLDRLAAENRARIAEREM